MLIPDGRAADAGRAGRADRAAGEVHDAKDKNRLRTFPSLMSTPYELQLLEWHATGQLALIDVAASAEDEGEAVKMARPGVKKIGAAGDDPRDRRRRPTASTCASPA